VTALAKLSQILNDLGFTPLESEIYVYLLQQSPGTGYKIAKGIGRSFTNTYKALAGLESRGAILLDKGEHKLFRAVPIEELMDQIEARFREKRRIAVESVKQLPSRDDDNRIYHLATEDQVYERFRQMLRECRKRALIELFPEPCACLRDPVEEAAARGIVVAARVYAGESLAGVHLVQSPFGDANRALWRSQWLALFVDGRQFLLGHLVQGGGGVYECVWSASPFIARTFYSFVNSDLHHYAFLPHLEKAGSVKDLRGEYNRLQEVFPIGGDLGFTDLMLPSLPDSEDGE
jgi:HTH-type transcriptional regulator, sugar sensing transcriptional regulator